MRNVGGRVAGVVVLLGLLGATTGCRKLAQIALEKAMAKADAGAASGDTVTSTDPDEQLQDKVDPYIVCQNDLSSAIFAARNRYLDWVNAKTGPTGKERVVYGVTGVTPPDAATKCVANVAKAKTLAPDSPALEKAGDAYAHTASELVTLINAADKYYDAKDYKDDKWAKAKEMHPQLMELWTTFGKEDKELHDAISAITKPLARRTLARIEKEEGKGFAWHRKNVLITARELVEAGAPDEDDLVDFGLYEASFKDLDTALDDLVQFGSTNRKDLDDPKKRQNLMAGTAYDSFARESEQFRKKAKEHLRCLRAAPAKVKKDGKIDLYRLPPCPEGARKDVVREYNEFINASNRYQFP